MSDEWEETASHIADDLLAENDQLARINSVLCERCEMLEGTIARLEARIDRDRMRIMWREVIATGLFLAAVAGWIWGTL